jgi:hypothetical protein
MSNRFNVSIEGPQASDALTEFLAINGIEGDAGPTHRGPVRRDAALLEAAGAIVGITGGIASVVTQILAWREKWRWRREAERFSVLIEDAAGNRLALEHATPEQITAALQTFSGDRGPGRRSCRIEEQTG